ALMPPLGILHALPLVTTHDEMLTSILGHRLPPDAMASELFSHCLGSVLGLHSFVFRPLVHRGRGAVIGSSIPPDFSPRPPEYIPRRLTVTFRLVNRIDGPRSTTA
ncbi:hypothetical protein BJV78DRAFT_1236198, partial [Lactifluus subvellereus]